MTEAVINSCNFQFLEVEMTDGVKRSNESQSVFIYKVSISFK